MDSANSNKGKRQESQGPERRGTEFLLEPPEQRAGSENISPGHSQVQKTPIPTQTQRITRARAERFLAVPPQAGADTPTQKIATDKTVKPAQLVSKYFSTNPQPQLTKIKSRKPTSEKIGTGIKPNPPTGTQRQAPLRCPKTTEPNGKPKYYNAWIESNSTFQTPLSGQAALILKEIPARIPNPEITRGSPTIVPGNRDILEIEEVQQVRPKTPGTPGRRQNETDEEASTVLQVCEEAQIEEIETVVGAGAEGFYCLNKDNSPLAVASAITEVNDNQVKYMFAVGKESDVASFNQSKFENSNVFGSKGFGVGRNICLADLARNAHKKQTIVFQVGEIDIDSYDSEEKWSHVSTEGQQSKSPSDGSDSDNSDDLQPPEKPTTSGQTIENYSDPELIENEIPEINSPIPPRPLGTTQPLEENFIPSPADEDKLSDDVSAEGTVTDHASLKVNNLDDRIGYNEIMALFPKAAAVTYPMYDRSGPPTMKPTRYCYVMFDDAGDASEAFEQMDGFIVDDIALDIEYRRYTSSS